ncbi:MAG: hypothetical protein JXQ90_01015 [Cyclobacteriaceae bacterium]
MIRKTLAFLSFILLGFNSFTQVFVPGLPDVSYAQILKIKNSEIPVSWHNSINYWDSLNWNLRGLPPAKAGLSINPISAQFVYNHNLPHSFNDGPVWKGVGSTAEIHGGLSFHKSRLHITINPVLFFSQNKGFPLATIKDDVSPYSYQFANKNFVSRKIDWVQRFGDESFAKAHLGQSELRYLGNYFTAAVSTQNFVMGPVKFNPLLMSLQAPGLPHLHLGTSKPIPMSIRDIELGKLETNTFQGFVSGSQFFDDVDRDDRRYINGLSVAYQLPYLDRLTVGFHKTMYKYFEHFQARDLFATIKKIDNGQEVSDSTLRFNDAFDQMGALFVDWLFPNVGFNVYLEWSRNDFNGTTSRRFFVSPEHSRAYTIGFQKVFDLPSKKPSALLASYEHTNLSRNMGWLFRPNPPYYQHILIEHGYTNDGQLLGAGIGGGGVSDNLGLTWHDLSRTLGFLIRRIRHDDDYFFERIQALDRQDAEYVISVNGLITKDQFTYGASLRGGKRYNMYYEFENDVKNASIELFFKLTL